VANVQAAESRSWIWGGGISPYGVTNQKLGMWLFIVSDSLTFAALLFGYAYLRHASDHWPSPFEFTPSIVGATVMTFCLLSSSLTMVLAVHNAGLGNAQATIKWLLGTIAGGVAFLVLHLNEWRTLIHEGLRPNSNPWGDAMFGGTFFTITGLHMVHVASGVIYICVIIGRTMRKTNRPDDVEICGLYWHFVDLVWMFVFPLLYLLSVNMSGGGAH